MSNIYSTDHFCCYKYQENEKPVLEVLHAQAGEIIRRDLADTALTFLLSGTFKLTYDKVLDKEIRPGKIMIFPPGCRVNAEITEDAHLLIFRVKEIIQLCNCLTIQHFYDKDINIKEDFYMLDVHPRIEQFIDNFTEILDDGIKCQYYFETKIKELFFLLLSYYPEQELKHFFSPLLSPDAQFMNLMYRNYRHVNSVQELADLSLYSNSGFKKQFYRVFGNSPSSWLRDRKSALILQDLNSSSLRIKEIADKYNFSSVSSFSTFCRKNFGSPPGKIRSGKSGKTGPYKKD